MNDHEVQILDRNGKRVQRKNDVIEDGDCLRVPMRMMDHYGNPGLVAAAALADTIKRNETFGARGHRSGFAIRDTAQAATIGNILDERDRKLSDAWKTPPAASIADNKTVTPVEKAAMPDTTFPDDVLFASRDKVVADRDKRVSEAWKS